MLAKVMGGTPYGVEAKLVEVQCDVGPGLPGFAIVGLAEKEVSEARERVRSALRNAGLPFPGTRITANLAPADLKKEGAGLDLPLAVALLAAMEEVPPERVEGLAFYGELALDGGLRPVRGTLAVTLAAKAAGLRGVVLPAAAAPEAALVEGISAHGAHNLTEVVEFLTGKRDLPPAPREPPPEVPPQWLDLRLVRGQEHARRALEIAAAGGHNLFTYGSQIHYPPLAVVLAIQPPERFRSRTAVYFSIGCSIERNDRVKRGW
jgi:magnesium chelatase family protein